MATLIAAASSLSARLQTFAGSLHSPCAENLSRRATAGLTYRNRARRLSGVCQVTLASDTLQPAPSFEFPVPCAAYVHLPFCKRKCLYCDFPVQAVGDSTRPAVTDSMERYVRHVCREIDATAVSLGQEPLRTLFFGGGTPSLISMELLALLIDTVKQRFGIMEGAEISMEIDPGTFTHDSLEAYQELGVTRFSVGVQSFQQELLEGIGRSHGLQDVREALSIIKAVEPPSWSLDLMSGLPHLTMDLWRESLQAAIATGAPHISVYDLQVEEGTPFARMYTPSTSPLPSETLGAEMFGEASRLLTDAGYEHYELSNYALPSHRCQHNMAYWTGESFYAFGLGAASYVAGRRYSRPRRMNEYYAWVDEFAEAGEGVPGKGLLPPDTPEEQLLDMIMLRLRLRDGLDLRRVSHRFGRGTASAMAYCLQKFADQGLVQLVSDVSRDVGLQRLDHSSHVRLVDPQGLLLSNDIMADLFAVAGEDD